MNCNLHLISGIAPVTRSLTPSEQSVVELAHLRNSEIAQLLGKKPTTVKAQFRSAMTKLGCETRTAAALLWQERKAA